MFTEPRQLIDETIDKLETVSVYFADEIDERIASAGKPPVGTLAAKESLQTIRILIPNCGQRREASPAVHRCKFVSV